MALPAQVRQTAEHEQITETVSGWPRLCWPVRQGCGHCCDGRFRAASGRAGFRAARRRPAAAPVNPASRKAATAV
jgi:hypothetical protein